MALHIFCTDTPIFWSIDYITPNSELSCSLYICICSLRYQPLKFRYTFDYCGDSYGRTYQKLLPPPLLIKPSRWYSGMSWVGTNKFPTMWSTHVQAAFLQVMYSINFPIIATLLLCAHQQSLLGVCTLFQPQSQL